MYFTQSILVKWRFSFIQLNDMWGNILATGQIFKKCFCRTRYEYTTVIGMYRCDINFIFFSNRLCNFYNQCKGAIKFDPCTVYICRPVCTCFLFNNLCSFKVIHLKFIRKCTAVNFDFRHTFSSSFFFGYAP